MADPVELPQGAHIPGKYSNYFTVSVGPEVVRIAFAEGFGSAEKSVFHTAVILTMNDARVLAETIKGTLDLHLASQSPQGRKDG